MARFIERILNEALLGFFALLSLFLMLAPLVFELPPNGERLMILAEYAIVALFALEYAAAWSLAGDRGRFMRDPWRVIDAMIIIAALIALLPLGPDFLRNSPVLRLIRLGRVALLGTRSGLALKSAAERPSRIDVSPDQEVSVFALRRSGEGFESISWDAALKRVGSPEKDWLFISGINEARLAPIAAALGVPENAVNGLFQSSVPRFDRLERFSTLFVRYPLPMGADGRMRRTPVLLVGTADNVVVLSRESTDLVQRVERRLATLESDAPPIVRTTVALVSEVIRAYTDLVERLEAALIDLEVGQLQLKDEAFLARSFELRADILRVRGSLKHLKSVLRDLSSGQLSIVGSGSGDSAPFGLLADDAADLYDGADDLRDSLQALVDLRLNVSAFQVNRVMRLLALLTALALIPATAGGLLGMNLADTPWPATLAQVAFGVAAGMAMSLYVFSIKGWLR